MYIYKTNLHILNNIYTLIKKYNNIIKILSEKWTQFKETLLPIKFTKSVSKRFLPEKINR